MKILRLCEKEQPITILMNTFDWNNRTKFRKKLINPLLEMELLSMTIPDKPRSSRQKYVITKKGKDLLQIENE